MGGTLAALGFLSQCGWDEDTKYAPQYRGTYLQIDSLVWWLDQEERPFLLPFRVRTICGAGRWLLALSTTGDSLYYVSAGAFFPEKSYSLPQPATALAVSLDPYRIYLLSPSSIGMGSSKQSHLPDKVQWMWKPSPQRFQHIAVAPSFLIAAGDRHIAAFRLEDLTSLFEGEVPGPVHHLWIDYPTEAVGTWQKQDTLWTFRYRHTARYLKVDTLQPSPYKESASSPYVRQNFGTEYVGNLSLTQEGLLLPGSHSKVQSFAADFMGGKGFFLRNDTIWRYHLSPISPPQFVLRQAGAQAIRAVPVYRYGSTEFTMR
ncbi:MAG: hypothetical protein N2170_03470 [Bacteroidia bacterium]|nr:hypothetical protein [Bacteroidia bacterium]